MPGCSSCCCSTTEGELWPHLLCWIDLIQTQGFPAGTSQVDDWLMVNHVGFRIYPGVWLLFHIATSWRRKLLSAFTHLLLTRRNLGGVNIVYGDTLSSFLILCRWWRLPVVFIMVALSARSGPIRSGPDQDHKCFICLHNISRTFLNSATTLFCLALYLRFSIIIATWY